jgi:hypothetical protein
MHPFVACGRLIDQRRELHFGVLRHKALEGLFRPRCGLFRRRRFSTARNLN